MFQTWSPGKSEVLEAIQKNLESYKDFGVSPKDLKLGVENETDVAQFEAAQGKLEIGSLAFSQFLGRLGIPVNFYRKCPDHIKIQLLEHFNTARGDKRYLFRCVQRPNDFFVRAILSSRYTTELDNHKVIPEALEALEEMGADTGWCTILHDHFRLENFFPQQINHDGVMLRAGVTITNSECGTSRLWVDPTLVLEREGSDGLKHAWVLTSRNEYSTGFTHVGETPKKEEFLAAVKRAKDTAEVAIIQYYEVMNDKLTKKQALRALEDMEAVPKRMIKVFEENNWIEDQMTKRDFVNRILMSCSDLPIVQFTLVEHNLSKFLGVFDNVETRMSKLAEELANL